MNKRAGIYHLHRFLAQHAFYALTLSSALAVGILAVRVVHVRGGSFLFLAWNLFLAWTPYVWSLWAAASQRRYPRDWWRLLLPGALWLLFFPNAPYLITDFVHLYERPPVPLWYDVGLLAAFAWSGCFLAVVSLQIMQQLVARLLGRALSWLFVCASVALCGLGVYLGRFERWNSWDIVLYPRDVLADALRPLIYPLSHVQPLAASAMFASLVLICYVSFMSLSAGARSTVASDE